MGKMRRAREKYHMACVREKNNQGSVSGRLPPRLTAENGSKCFDGPSSDVASFDNIFSGLDIDVDKLKRTLSDDAVSVRSIAKSIKSKDGRHMKKEEKRKLKHSLFIQKIDMIYQKMKDLKKKKKKGGSKAEEDEGQQEGLLPTLEELVATTRPAVVKKRCSGPAVDGIVLPRDQEGKELEISTPGEQKRSDPLKRKMPSIQKAKHRKKSMLDGVAEFKRCMTNLKSMEDVLEGVTEIVRNRVNSGIL